MAIAIPQINMANFQQENLVQTGQIQNVLNHISHYPNHADQVHELMDCLSQTLGLQGAFKGHCASTLRCRIIELAKQNPASAQSVANLPPYRFNSGLATVIEKINYLNKNRLSKWLHHFENYMSSSNDAGAICLMGGIAFFFAGQYIRALTPDNPKAQQWGTFATTAGVTFFITPFAYSLCKAFTDDPT